VTLESNVAGVLLDAVSGYSVTRGTAASVTILTSTLSVVADANTSTTSNIYPLEARGDGALGAGGDAVLPEALIAEVATAATTYNRVSWL